MTAPRTRTLTLEQLPDQPLLFAEAEIPQGANPAAVVWCGYPAAEPWADCLLWLRGGVKQPGDCGDCVHRLSSSEVTGNG